MKKSQKSVIIVGEEHGNTLHMEKVAELVCYELGKRKKVALALEQNCGNKSLQDIKDIPSKLRTDRQMKHIVEKHRKQNIENDGLPEDVKEYYDAHCRPSIPQLIKLGIDKYCQDMEFDISTSSDTKDTEYEGNINRLNYTTNMNKMAQYAAQKSMELYFISVDINDSESKESPERDEGMSKTIIESIKKHKIDTLVYPVGSAHIYRQKDSDKTCATLLAKKDNIELILANFYNLHKDDTKDVLENAEKDLREKGDEGISEAQINILNRNLAYRTVKNDINGFIQKHIKIKVVGDIEDYIKISTEENDSALTPVDSPEGVITNNSEKEVECAGDLDVDTTAFEG